MKKKFIIICSIIILLLGGIVALHFYKTTKVEKFNIEEYKQYIIDFPSDEILGSIDDADMAKEKAEYIWRKIYGDSIKDERPYKVFIDDSNDAWLVTGSLHTGLFSSKKGGTAHIIIKKSDGKVLAIWHEK